MVWDGAVLRTVSDAGAAGLAEGRRLTKVFGLPGSDRGTQRTVRALMAGYLLYQLTGDKDYREFADAEASLPKAEGLDPAAGRRRQRRRRSPRC